MHSQQTHTYCSCAHILTAEYIISHCVKMLSERRHWQITFFPRFHLSIRVHPVLSDVNQDFPFKVSDTDISHLSDLEGAK